MMTNDIKVGESMLIAYSIYVSCNQIKTLTPEFFFLVDLDNNTSIRREQHKIMVASLNLKKNDCHTIPSKIGRKILER